MLGLSSKSLELSPVLTARGASHCINRVSATPGTPGNLLEFKNLLELLEIYWNFVYPPGKINIQILF